MVHTFVGGMGAGGYYCCFTGVEARLGFGRWYILGRK